MSVAPEDLIAFNMAFKNSITHEGGYVDDKDDKGGATNYGVSFNTYKQYYPNATKQDIKDLTLGSAKDFYYKHFWSKNNYHKIDNMDISTKVFDACINMGAKQAHKCLQRALKAVGNEDIVDDGILGSMSLKAINKISKYYYSFGIVSSMKSEVACIYRLIVKNDPTQKKFFDGWIKRAYKKLP